jgi:hypothetical protein
MALAARAGLHDVAAEHVGPARRLRGEPGPQDRLPGHLMSLNGLKRKRLETPCSLMNMNISGSQRR